MRRGGPLRGFTAGGHVGLAPSTPENLATQLALASAAGRTVMPIGGGRHSRQGKPIDADITLSTINLDRVLAHEPADLTVTVQAGASVAMLADALAAAGQCWPQAPPTAGATVGGVIAAGVGTRQRLREGPIRDGLLEVVVATGDGRLIKGGGKTVKGVTGYDLPRLMVGSLGTLGVITEVTLKLWPQPIARGWFAANGSLADRVLVAKAILTEVHRPAAVLLSPDTLSVELMGPEGDVTPPVGFEAATEPAPLTGAGIVRVGVAPTAVWALAEALENLGLRYEAQAGVGLAEVAVANREELAAVRATAIQLGGHAIVVDAPAQFRSDPWGPPPEGTSIMHKLKAVFDPAGILAPGRLVGAP